MVAVPSASHVSEAIRDTYLKETPWLEERGVRLMPSSVSTEGVCLKCLGRLVNEVLVVVCPTGVSKDNPWVISGWLLRMSPKG